MKAADLRRSFLDFFAQRGHVVEASSSLVPTNDPTLFFTNAGMVQFKDVFTGVERRESRRATSVQKCMRVSGKHNDLENVGFTARHHTLFEMLGNFSFGDYFKPEAIAWAWEYLTVVLGLPAERLFVSVFEEDDESYALWLAQGVPPERIARCGAKDNFWSMGPTGPCGPCTEIHWDLGEVFVPDGEPDVWGRGWDAGRIMEIWNLVFMQFERYQLGDLIEQRDLPRPSVDTGMGLERLAAVMQGRTSNWEIDELAQLIAAAGDIAGTNGPNDASAAVGKRVIADHARAAAFLIADGVMPSAEDRGYVLRRVMRRAIRYGVRLGIDRPFLHEIVERVIAIMGAAYPELIDRREFIGKVVLNEERTFRETLDRGLALIESAFDAMRAAQQRVLPGATAFQLHDTFGFPPDLTQVIAGEQGFTVDMVGYAEHMEAQRERGRSAWKGTGDEAIGEAARALEGAVPATRFDGYERLDALGVTLALLVDGRRVQSVSAGTDLDIVVDVTAFYAESGGQAGDRGRFVAPGLVVEIRDTQKPAGSVFLHRGRVTQGVVREGDRLVGTVDAAHRADVMRNHTATHLLHAALRAALGGHVQQRGSLVDGDRLRFDFSHFEPVSADQRAAIETAVNEQILANSATAIFETSMSEAQSLGAMALFGEKYGERVRVVQVPGFSTELCGGTHCAATGQIGFLKITSEGGIAAGVRRIEALTGRGALRWMRAASDRESALSERLRTPMDEAVGKVERLLDERKTLLRQVEELKRKVVAGGVGQGPQVREIQGVKVIATVLDGVTGKELRGHADNLLGGLGSGIVVLGAEDEGKASLLVKVSGDLVGRVQAGDLVRELAREIGGSGGGRADMAQAGGREPERLPNAIALALVWLDRALAG